MSRLAEIDRLQVALLALLLKDGTRMTVGQLAKVTASSEPLVTNALFGPYMSHQVDFDVRADAYWATPQGNDLPTERTKK